MVKSKFEIVMWRILAFAIIFTQLLNCNIVFADEAGYNAETVHSEIREWLSKEEKNPIRSYTYKENGTENVIYALNMPGLNNSNICYDASTYGYTYLIKDDSGNVLGKVPIQIDVICMPTDEFPADLNSGNYSQYIDGGGSQFLEEKDGSQLKILDIDSNVQMTYTYAVRIDGGAATIYELKSATPVEQSKSLGEVLEDAAAGVAGFALSLIKNALAEIVNKLLLAIGDGIQSLINFAMGEEENLTVYKIIFNN